MRHVGRASIHSSPLDHTTIVTMTQISVPIARTGRGSVSRRGIWGISCSDTVQGYAVDSGQRGRYRVSVAHIVDIEDPQDSRVDDFRDLSNADRRPDRPGGKGLVVAEGVLVVERMVTSRFAPFALLGVDRRRAELEPLIGDLDIPFYRASAQVMAEIVGFHLNRGVLALARRPEPLALESVLDAATTVAVLEGVNDHENIGSIFRNASGLGACAVLFGGRCSDPLYRRSVRVSMGHVLRVPFAEIPDWPDGLQLLRDKGFQIVGLTPDPAAAPLGRSMSSGKVALLLGSEGPGLAEETMQACDVLARIPMSRGTDSLNVATAAAIAFYERVRMDA